MRTWRCSSVGGTFSEHAISPKFNSQHPLNQHYGERPSSLYSRLLWTSFLAPPWFPSTTMFYSITKRSFSILNLVLGIWQITMSAVSWSPTTGYHHLGPRSTTELPLSPPKYDLQEVCIRFFWQTAPVTLSQV